MKVYAIQSKNGIIINIGVSVRNQMIGVLAKRVMCGIIVSVTDCELMQRHKIYEYLDTKNCSCEKRLIGKVVLACEDEV